MFVEIYLHVRFRKAASSEDRVAKKFNSDLKPVPKGVRCFYLPALRTSQTT